LREWMQTRQGAGPTGSMAILIKSNVVPKP
jgi:hypothetical protein